MDELATLVIYWYQRICINDFKLTRKSTPSHTDAERIISSNTLNTDLVGWLIYFTSCQHNNGYIDGGSQRTIFPGGHPSEN
jgi:hypothetical protein